MLSMLISTHTSRVGCDKFHVVNIDDMLKFLLTHPVWDVTYILLTLVLPLLFLLTHPVWDVTCIPCRYIHIMQISTHTSRVGCDFNTSNIKTKRNISTHTSRVGCDACI